MIELRKDAHFLTDPRILGYGNENRVSELLAIDGEDVYVRSVLKNGNNAFFGWQTPRFEDIKKYLEILEQYGIRVSSSVQIHEDPVIERAQNLSKVELVQSLVRNNLTIGFVLKMLTKQWGRKCNYAITEDYSEEKCLTIDDLKDDDIRRQVRELLAACEEIYEKEGLFVDPLGGAAISASMKYLVNPTNVPILSNLAIEDGQLVLTDFGLMDMRNTERVYALPYTEFLMRMTLGTLGHIAFEAMNVTLRSLGEDIEPRPMHIGNIVPKIGAEVGCRTVFVAQKVYESLDWTWLATIGETARQIS